jgi:transaldolase
MKTNPLKQLETLGQSIWLDYIRRDLMTSGNLKKLIANDELRGITSNPAIFEKAFTESPEYDQAILELSQKGVDVKKIYEALSQKDIQEAADEFLAVYNQTNHLDGYVSLEVNPHLAHDTAGTIEEARRLWKALGRPNVLIKVPATKEGLPAITQLISEGINVNVTLLFGLPRYHDVAQAYITGIEKRLAQGNAVNDIASVASFFLSRIDTLIDPLLQKQNEKPLQGKIAIASAKIAYHMYSELFNSDRFKPLMKKGAQTQRLLWASTSTKNPDYSDIKYIEALIGPETVNTVPPEVLEAYRDHGDPKIRLNTELEQATESFHALSTLGIDIHQITQQLEDEGVDKFNKAYDQLIAALKKKIIL